jgi:hypothetical protein
MNIRIITLALVVSLIATASPSRLLAQAGADQCEEAIAQKVKKARKPEKVTFVSGARKAIPHGPLTHYAGKGSYLVPGGDWTEFEWFCDVYGASGKPANLYYEISKTEATAPTPAQKKTAAKKEKEAVVVDDTAASACQSAVEAEIRKKNREMSNLAFHAPKEFQAGKEGKLLEGDGSFLGKGKGQGKGDEEMEFDYRCLYDKLSGKITSKSFRVK